MNLNKNEVRDVKWEVGNKKDYIIKFQMPRWKVDTNA